MPFGADQAAVDRVTAQLAGVGRLGVAFSGGVDSATLLALAVRALGPARVLAVLGVSPSLADDERAAAHAVARFVGAPVVEVVTREGELARVPRQRPGPLLPLQGRAVHPHRRRGARAARARRGRLRRERRRRARGRTGPGARAATGHGVLRPLADAGLDKAAVRRIARGARPALRGQAGRAVPGLAHPAPRAGDPGEAGAGRGGRTGAARAGFHRLPGAPPRRRRPGRAAGRRHRAGRRGPLRERSTERRRAAGFRFVAVDLAGIQSGAFTLPLVAASSWLTTPPTGRRRAAGFAELDLDRARRRGYPEAVLCAGKTPGAGGGDRGGAARARRPAPCSPGRARSTPGAVLDELPDAFHAEDCGLLAWPAEPPEPVGGRVLVVAAGTSDHAVAREALLTARHLGRARGAGDGRRRRGPAPDTRASWTRCARPG